MAAAMFLRYLSLVGLASASALVACARSDAETDTLASPATSAAVPPSVGYAPPATGSYAGVYVVPIVKPELAAAATFPTPEVKWTLHPNGTATLDYDLPVGLVGGKVGVEFTGPVDVPGMKAHLTGRAGTADCTWQTGKLECHEVMRGILPLSPDMNLVRERAQAEYAGPLQHRLDVVGTFGTDPIGVVFFDPSTPGVQEDQKDKEREERKSEDTDQERPHTRGRDR